MRTTILSALMFATTVTAVPAVAQDRQWQANRDYRDDVRDAQRDYRRDIRRANDRGDVRDARRDYRRDVRDAQRDRRRDVRDIRRDQARDWRQYRSFDHNRFEPGQRAYLADRYYRDGSFYQPRRLGRNDRIYRGGNGRYYCRRNDGTTGLIIGGLAGGGLGSLIGNGSSNLLGALIGAGGGALLGRSIDRGQVVCR